MSTPLHHPGERDSNAARDLVARFEPRTLRTYTPTQAALPSPGRHLNPG